MKIRVLFSVAAILLASVLGSGSAGAQDQPKIQPNVAPTLPSPKIDSCGTRGYTCASGYSCKLDTSVLGTPSIGGSFSPTYACTISSNTCGNGCPPGWKNDGPSGGGYKCSPAAALCSSGKVAWPAPTGGYFCMTVIQG
jgi:hypothetical protein